MFSNERTTMILCGNAMITRPIQNERDSGLDAFLRLAIGSGSFSLRRFSRRHAAALGSPIYYFWSETFLPLEDACLEQV